MVSGSRSATCQTTSFRTVATEVVTRTTSSQVSHLRDLCQQGLFSRRGPWLHRSSPSGHCHCHCHCLSSVMDFFVLARSVSGQGDMKNFTFYFYFELWRLPCMCRRSSPKSCFAERGRMDKQSCRVESGIDHLDRSPKKNRKTDKKWENDQKEFYERRRKRTRTHTQWRPEKQHHMALSCEKTHTVRKHMTLHTANSTHDRFSKQPRPPRQITPLTPQTATHNSDKQCPHVPRYPFFFGWGGGRGGGVKG